MWTCVLLCLLLTSATFYILARFHRGIDKKQQQLSSNSELQLQLHNTPVDLKYSLLVRQHRRNKQPGEPEGLFQFAETGNSLLYTFSMLLLGVYTNSGVLALALDQVQF